LRSACDQQHFPERRSGSKIFAGAAFRRVPAPLQPCQWDFSVVRSSDAVLRARIGRLDGVLAQNQAFQNASDRMKLCGVDKRVGADVEKYLCGRFAG